MSKAREEQLRKWVEGISEHNNVDGECCPDFSCCNKSVEPTPIDMRMRFAEAYRTGDEKTRMAMLGAFLGGVMAVTGVNAHVTGDGAKDE
jgi:hypothetical protein